MTELLKCLVKDIHLITTKRYVLKSCDTVHVKEMNHFNCQKHIHS